MTNRGKYLVFSISALLLGGACYVFCREDTHLSVWANGLLKTVFAVGEQRAAQNALLRFYLPDMLWSLALSLGLMAIYDPRGKGAWLCAGAAAACGGAWELAQWMGVVRGTGDFGDILMYLLGGLISSIINRKARKEK